jgi:hypothetical protein
MALQIADAAAVVPREMPRCVAALRGDIMATGSRRSEAGEARGRAQT